MKIIFRNTYYCSLATEIYAEIFCWHLIARNCTKLHHSRFEFENNLTIRTGTHRAHSTERWEPGVSSYHILLRLCLCFISAWLRSWNSKASWRRLVTSAQASHTIHGRFACTNTRSSASPLIFGSALNAWAIKSSTMDLSKQRIMHWSAHPRLRLFTLDIRALCILGSGIYLTNRVYSALGLPLILRRLHSGLLHPRIASSTDNQTLGSRNRYMGAIGTLEEEIRP